MALTGGAKAHDPQYGCESRSGPLKLGADMRPHTGRGGGRHIQATASEHLVAREVGPPNGGNQ